MQSPALFPDSELVSEETRAKWRHYIEFLTAHPDWMTLWEMEVFHRVEERVG